MTRFRVESGDGHDPDTARKMKKERKKRKKEDKQRREQEEKDDHEYSQRAMSAQQEIDDAMDDDDVAKWAEQRRKMRAALEAQHIPKDTPFPVLATPAPDYSPGPGEPNGKQKPRSGP